MSTPIVDKMIEQTAGMPNETQWRVRDFYALWLFLRNEALR